MSLPERGIPESQQTQPDTNLRRRDFLTRIAAGGAAIAGLMGGSEDIVIPILADKETRKNLQVYKITKLDPEAIKLTRQINNESAEQKLQNRTEQEVTQTIEIQAQNDLYKREGNKRYLGAGLLSVYMLRRRREQRESTEQVQNEQSGTIFEHTTPEEGNIPPSENVDIDGMTLQEIKDAMGDIKRKLYEPQRPTPPQNDVLKTPPYK